MKIKFAKICLKLVRFNQFYAHNNFTFFEKFANIIFCIGQAKTEESQCNSRSKTKAIYLNLAASTLKRLRAMILEDFTSKITNSTNESTVNRTVPSTTVTTTTFKTNNLRIAHNIAPEAAAAIKKNKITEPSKLKTYKEKKSILSTGFSIQPKEKHLAPTSKLQSFARYS